MLSHPVIEVDDISYVPDFDAKFGKGDLVKDELTGFTGVIKSIDGNCVGIDFLDSGCHCFIIVPIWDVVKLKFTIGYNRSN